MRPLARAAGKALRIIATTAAVIAVPAQAEAPTQPSTDMARARADDLLMPHGFIAGGLSAPASPVPGQPPTGTYLKLLQPMAVAANGPDLYVADIAQRLLLRFDTTNQSVSALRELPAMQGVRLKAGQDGSVYVLRPDRGTVERLARDGRRLASFASKYEILRPADVVIEPGRNRVWISDTAGGVFAFHPSGRMSEPIAGRGDGFADDFGGATLLASGRDRVSGFEPDCRCIIQFDYDGAVIGRFGHGLLVNPVDIAIDTRGRTWIVDRGDRRLKVFEDDELIASVAAGQLGLTDITAISIDMYRAYISDGPGGRIGIFAIGGSSRRAP